MKKTIKPYFSAAISKLGSPEKLGLPSQKTIMKSAYMTAEKWVDTKTGKPCGTGSKSEYCRPSKRVSSKTPVTKSEMSKSTLKKKQSE